MSKSLTKHIAYVLFVVLMTNFGVWGFSGAKLAHEFKHAGDMTFASAGQKHFHAAHAGNALDQDDVPSAAEHQVLHAVDHVQFFADTGMNRGVAPVISSLVPSHFADQALPLSTFDPPFRPPRGGDLPA